MRLLSLVFFLTLGSLLLSTKSYAQWGMGAYGLGGTCPYNYEVAGGSVAESDLLDEIETDLRDKKDRQKDLKADLRKLDRDVQQDKNNLTYTLDSAKANRVISHLEGPLGCGAYQNYWTDESGQVFRDDGSDPDIQSGKTQGSLSYDPFDDADWFKYCDMKMIGNLDVSLCEKHTVRGGSAKCRLGISGLQMRLKEKEAKEQELQAIEAEIDSLNEQKRNLKREASKAMREAQREALEGGCLECIMAGNGAVYQPRRSSALNTIGGVVSGAIGAFAGYMGLRQATRVNAQLGFPTNPSMGFGWPMGMMLGSMALYGAINGGMNGGFGCNGGMGGAFGPGGLMGYPMGMYPGFPGGGMWMPGGMPMSGMGMGLGMGMGMMPMSGMGMGMMPMSGMGMMDGGMMQMQMQMQQYQVMMEQQRRVQENMYSRMRVVSGLQQELYSLLNRLQQAQMGVNLGVDLSFPSYPTSYPAGGYYPNGSYYPNGGGYYPNGNYYPGGYSPNGTVVPGRGPGVPPVR